MEGGIGKVGMEMNRVFGMQSHEKVMSHYESWLKTHIFANGAVLFVKK
jgi:hypothetical protein